MNFHLILLNFAWAFLPFDAVHSLASVLISSPFDNFRIECPQSSGAQRLAIRMVESQGQKRQDTVFVLSCQHIFELYPWLSMPEEVAAHEREDCRYTQQFDILLDHEVEWTCKEREYLAGIARLSDTRIQLECCRMRTRQEASCVELDYAKPIGSGARVEIEYQAKLLNSISVDGDIIRVRFCDLSPRQIDEIMSEATTTRQTTLAPITRQYYKLQTNRPPVPLEYEPLLLNNPRKLAKEKDNVRQHQMQEAAETREDGAEQPQAPPTELALVDEVPSVEEPARDVKFTSDMQSAQPQQLLQQQQPIHSIQQQPQTVQQVQPVQINKNSAESPPQQPINQQIQAAQGVGQLQASQPIEIGQQNGEKQQIVGDEEHAQIGKPKQILNMAKEQQQLQNAVQQLPITKNNQSANIVSREIDTLPLNPIHVESEEKPITTHSVAIPEQQLSSENEAKNNSSIDESSDIKEEEQQPNAIQQQKTENPQIQRHENQQNTKAHAQQNLHTIQFGRIVQAVQEREQGLAAKMMQHGHLPRLDTERNKHENISENSQIQSGRQQKVQTEFGEQNKNNEGVDQMQSESTTSTSTDATTKSTIKSNLLIRRKGMHEFTITLAPYRVGEPIQPRISADRERQLAEMAIQKQLDAIREIERQISVKTIEIGSGVREATKAENDSQEEANISQPQVKTIEIGKNLEEENPETPDSPVQQTETKERSNEEAADQKVPETRPNSSDQKRTEHSEQPNNGSQNGLAKQFEEGFWVPKQREDKLRGIQLENGTGLTESKVQEAIELAINRKMGGNKTVEAGAGIQMQKNADADRLANFHENDKELDEHEQSTSMPNDGEAMHRILFGEEPVEGDTQNEGHKIGITGNEQEGPEMWSLPHQSAPSQSQIQIKKIEQEAGQVPLKMHTIELGQNGQPREQEVQAHTRTISFESSQDLEAQKDVLPIQTGVIDKIQQQTQQNAIESKDQQDGQGSKINDQLDPQNQSIKFFKNSTNAKEPSIQSTPKEGQQHPGYGRKKLQIFSINLQPNATRDGQIPKGPFNEFERANLTRIDGNSLRIHSIDLKSLRQPVTADNDKQIDSNEKHAASEEVKPAERIVETMFPMEIEREQRAQKELENVREASAELLHSIAGMMEHRQRAQKIIEKVKENAGIGNSPPTSREFAETMFREIEEHEKSAAKEHEGLMRKSMEMLSELGNLMGKSNESILHPKEQRKAPQNPNLPPPTALFTSLQPTPNFTSLFSVDTEVEDISVEQSEMEDKANNGTMKEKAESDKLVETTTIETVMNKTEENGIRNATMRKEEEEEYEDESEESVENEKESVPEVEIKDNGRNESLSNKEVESTSKNNTTENERLAKNEVRAKAAKTHRVHVRKGDRTKPKSGTAEKWNSIENVQENNADATSERPLSPAELPPLDAFPSPPPSNRVAATLPPQLPQLPPKISEEHHLISRQQQFGARTVTEKAMRAGEDYEVADEEDGVRKGKNEDKLKETHEATAEKQEAEKEIEQKVSEKFEERKLNEKEETIQAAQEEKPNSKLANEKQRINDNKNEEESTKPNEDKEKAEDKQKEKDNSPVETEPESVEANEETTVMTTKRRFPTTTRLPLYKRRQLDRIALQVFGPAAFDPTESPPPAPQHHHQSEEEEPRPRRVFPARRPRPKLLSTSTPSTATALPDEETDNSPFDAERALLLHRLRQLHRVNARNQQKEQSSQSDEEDQRKQPEEVVDHPPKMPRHRGRFDRLESRFDKESPFDSKEVGSGSDAGTSARKAEIRRKPSIDSPNEQKITDSDIESPPVPMPAQHRKDGTPMYSPKDNVPMKIPATFTSDHPKRNLSSGAARTRIAKRPIVGEQQHNNDVVADGELLERNSPNQDILVPMNSEESRMQNVVFTTLPSTSSSTTSMPSTLGSISETTSQPVSMQTEKSEQLVNYSTISSTVTRRAGKVGTHKHAGSSMKVPAVDNYWAFWTTKATTTTTDAAIPANVFYNADKYFRLPSRKALDSRQQESVLTFCTKSLAIRDSSNLPIACAGEDGQVWSPPRCPPGTGCLPAADSAFHICCPISNGRR